MSVVFRLLSGFSSVLGVWFGFVLVFVFYCVFVVFFFVGFRVFFCFKK